MDTADEAYSDDGAYAEGEYGAQEAPPQTPTAGGSVVEDATQAQVITVGDLSLQADDPNDILEQAKKIATDAKGSITAAELRSAGDGEYSYASATFRVPPAAFDQVVADVQALADVVDWRQSATDVSGEVIDLDARISGLRASIKRLEAMMLEATSTSSLLEAEGMLTQRQGELNSLLSQRAHYADQVGMSTLNLTVSPTPLKITPTRTGATASLRDGWDSLMAFGAGLIEHAAFLLPWLIALGLVTVLIVVVVRTSSRRTRRKRGVGPAAGARPPGAAPAGAVPPAGPEAQLGPQGPVDPEHPAPPAGPQAPGPATPPVS
jgi:hypothetical protein